VSLHSSELTFAAPRESFSVFRRFVDTQIRWSRRFDSLFVPEEMLVDGNRDFKDRLVPAHLAPGAVVYDVGGGKHPNIGQACKRQSGLTVVGLDISEQELSSAPAGCYDRTVCADITQYRGSGEAGLVICDALLEHVRDTDGALEAMAGILKPGGKALLFVPSRRAVYAGINRLLPEPWKRWLLFRIYPQAAGAQGFPAYYDGCTPAEIVARAARHGFAVETLRCYFHSPYFEFFLPLQAAWRCAQLLLRGLSGEQSAETFSVVLRRKG
jgi:SAM-dependent methyltransferase